MPQQNRADEGELETRLLIIADMLVAGRTQAEIVTTCLKEHAEWDVTDRQIRNYVKTAWDRFATEALGIDRKAESRLAGLRLDHIYARAMDAQRFNVARSAVMDKVKLFKLDAPSQEYSWKQALEELGISAGDSFEDLVAVISGRSNDETEG